MFAKGYIHFTSDTIWTNGVIVYFYTTMREFIRRNEAFGGR